MAFLAWPARCWSSLPDLVPSIALVVASAAVGVTGWSGEPRLLPAAMLFPALWALAPTRVAAALVAAGYFLAASRGLPQGVANFYGSGVEWGIVLWVGASSAFVGVHTAMWSTRPGRGRAARYGVAALLMSVPPFGIVGWAHPITASGIVFPGWGWLGLAATALGLLAMTTRWRTIAAPILGGFWMVSAANWASPTQPNGWLGVETQFRGAKGHYAGYDQQIETIRMVLNAVNEGAEVVVLPESAAGIWTPTTESLWREALQGIEVIVNLGAIIVGPDGYDNVMLEVSASGAEVLYRERMPVPVSMWQPWLAWIGEPAGARADFFANPVVDLHSRRVAPLICYEQLLVWPILQSMLNTPEMIIATGNGWWTSGTAIVDIQLASTQAWARLFDLPAVMVFNRSPLSQ